MTEEPTALPIEERLRGPEASPGASAPPAWILLGAVLLAQLVACGGGPPIPDAAAITMCLAAGGDWDYEARVCRMPDPEPCEVGDCDRSAPEMCFAGACVPCQPDLEEVPYHTDVDSPHCSTEARPIKHYPPTSECPILTEDCDAPPGPQCVDAEACDCYRGDTWDKCDAPPEPQCVDAEACDCYRVDTWRECPAAGDCKLGTPTARSLIARGIRAEARPSREGRKGIGVTAWARFGREYYCTDEMNWPEACAAGRREGPVAPDGHPQRVACEKQFYEQDWALLETVGDGGSHMSLDPWQCIREPGQPANQCTNQNHPRNVRLGLGATFGNHESWVKELHRGHWYIVSGMIGWCTGHGRGLVCASAKGGVARTCIRINQ